MNVMEVDQFDRRRETSEEYICPICGMRSSTIDYGGSFLMFVPRKKPAGMRVKWLRGRCRNGHEWMEKEAPSD